MPLDLSSLVSSIDALRRSLRAVDANAGQLSSDLQETVRAGVVQHFEVAYEQCWKFIQRWIRENTSVDEADHPRTLPTLCRRASRAARSAQ